MDGVKFLLLQRATGEITIWNLINIKNKASELGYVANTITWNSICMNWDIEVAKLKEKEDTLTQLLILYAPAPLTNTSKQ